MAEKIDFANLQQWAKAWREFESKYHFFQLLGKFPDIVRVISEETDMLSHIQSDKNKLLQEIAKLVKDRDGVEGQLKVEKEGMAQFVSAVQKDNQRRINEDNSLTATKLEENRQIRADLEKEITQLRKQAQDAITLRQQEENKLAEVRRQAVTLRTELRGLT